MKLMFASDLHGSRYYVQKTLERYEEESPDRLILLGDLLYHGPRNDLPRDYDTKAVTAMLNALTPAPLCVKGNCDGEVDQMVLHFPILNANGLLFANGRTAYITHGHHMEELAPLLSAGDILFFGHFHTPEIRREKGVFYVDPGSVSLPKNGFPRSYLIWEEDRLLWKGVETGAVWKEETLD